MPSQQMPKVPAYSWDAGIVPPGESQEITLVVSESFSGMTIPIRVFVRRGLEEGPAISVTAAIHGDEINGAGTIRKLIHDDDLKLQRGTLILVPVVNILGFDRHTRYLPDRRDLNRCFPGSKKGSLAGRMARRVFDEIVGRADYCIDLHTASVRRTNFPNLRADMTDPEVAKLAKAFGAEVVVSGTGPAGSFRREACLAGRPTIVFEAGEVWKVEPAILEYALRGVHNVLSKYGMIDPRPDPPSYRMVIESSTWVRAESGGFLEFHVAPGDIIHKGDAIATNTSITGTEQNVLEAPFDAMVIGMSTLPAVSPGDPVVHLGRLDKKHRKVEKIHESLDGEDLHERVRDDLATNVVVAPREENGDEV